MSIGWFDLLATAKTYFTDERLITTAWDALATDALKTKALLTAYNRLYYSQIYTLPDYASATADELIFLQKAQAEFAYYLAQHLADEDRRKGIQAQGVIAAGIVKESYESDFLEKLPIPPFVDELLDIFKTNKPFGICDIDRNENYDVDEDVKDLDND